MWPRCTTRIATGRITIRSSARRCFSPVHDHDRDGLSASFFAHGAFVPQPNKVAVRIVQFSAVAPEMALRLVEKLDASGEKLAMLATDIVDLNRQRTFFAGQRGLGILKEDGEVVIVPNGRK